MTFLLRGVAFGMFGVVVVYGAVLAAIYIKPLRTAVTIAYMLAFAPPAGTPLPEVPVKPAPPKLPGLGNPAPAGGLA